MKKIVLVLGIASMLFSCSNEKAEQVESQRQIDSINRALDYELKLIKLGGYRSKLHKAYLADSLGLNSVDKINYINKK
jgi:hypothetical protein